MVLSPSKQFARLIVDAARASTAQGSMEARVILAEADSLRQRMEGAEYIESVTLALVGLLTQGCEEMAVGWVRENFFHVPDTVIMDPSVQAAAREAYNKAADSQMEIAPEIKSCFHL